MKKIIVVSAINLVEAGPLTILQECLKYLSGSLSGRYEIIALVNKNKLFPFENINYLEFPKSKKSWINRLYYEYYYFKQLAKQYKPLLWLSLHDITPNVTAQRLAVYCHNASPFYKLPLKEAIIDPKFALFNAFYKYLYRINIKKNDFVIVQQDWLRNRFSKFYERKNIIVSYLNVFNDSKEANTDKSIQTNARFIFFYPALPRVFKNFEVIYKATEILLKQGICDFRIILTISGTENKYSKHIYNSFKHIKNFDFIGIQTRKKILELYNSTNCVIFPSKLETWGIPITETKLYNKPLLLADLEYAHETLGVYEKVKFFDPNSHEELAQAMKDMINQTIIFDKTDTKTIQPPFTQNWKELFDILLTDNFS